MTMEDIDAFAAMFPGPPGAARREQREERARRERKTQQTEKQRRRGAVRTAQLNFRCSPAFKQRTAALAAQLDCSIADLFEMALDELARAKGVEKDG